MFFVNKNFSIVVNITSTIIKTITKPIIKISSYNVIILFIVELAGNPNNNALNVCNLEEIISG